MRDRIFDVESLDVGPDIRLLHDSALKPLFGHLIVPYPRAFYAGMANAPSRLTLSMYAVVLGSRGR